MNINRPLVLAASLIALAACAQVPTPGGEASPNLAPQTFGSSGTDVALSLAKHSAGVYVMGYTTGDLHATNKGEDDLFIRKYDTKGALLWGRQFGTPAQDHQGGTDHAGVASDANNNAYVVSATMGSLAGSRGLSDALLRKYTPGGSVAWTRQFGTPDYDWATDVAVHGSSVYVSGDSSGSGASLTKFTTSGTLQWTRFVSSSSVNDVAVDGSGNAYLVGATGAPLEGEVVGLGDMFVRKYSPDGRVLWTRQLSYEGLDGAVAVAVFGNSVYLAGNVRVVEENETRNDGIRVIKYTSSGAQLWEKRVGASDDDVYDLSADGSGVALAGGTGYTSGFNGFTYKLDPGGTFVWSQLQSTSNVDATKAVLIRTSSEVYVAGETYGALVATNRGERDAFLRRLNGTTGATVWTDQ